MKILKLTFKFSLNQLANASAELFCDQLVIVVNVKPTMGELEMRMQKKVQPIIYIKISTAQGVRRLADLKVRMEHTQVIQHIVGLGAVYDFTIQSDQIDLDKIVDSLIEAPVRD